MFSFCDCAVEEDIEFVEPESKDEDDSELTVVDSDLSTSQLARDAATSVGVRRTVTGREVGNSTSTTVKVARKRVAGAMIGTRAKRQHEGSKICRTNRVL